MEVSKAMSEDEMEEAPVEETSEEEISVEEFLELPEAVPGRATKVNYDAVLKEILGKPIPVKRVGEIMLENSVDKPTVYPSEITRFLKSLTKKGYEVLFRSKDGKRWVLVRKKSK